MKPLNEGIDFVSVPDQMRLHGKYYQLSKSQRRQAKELEQKYMQMYTDNQSPDEKCGGKLHPYYYHVYESTLPPESAYRIKRAEIDRVSAATVEEASSKEFKPNRRYIFRGYDNWTQLEKIWIAKIKNELK